MIAAIGTDGTRPVVWGLGDTEATARHDARYYDVNWADGGSALAVVSQLTVTLIKQGEVSCEALGITVHCDRNGKIISAEVAQ
jgi:hypothetical protein